MQIEYEATFPNIDKDEIRKRLKKAEAKLVRPEFLQKRINYALPKGPEVIDGWLRVRDEGDKITMSHKVVDGDRIGDQKELCLEVDNFDQATEFLKGIGCRQKAYQETKRELWMLDDVEIAIDEWPFLEPFIEIEGRSEEQVKSASEKLGLDFNSAIFCAVDELYSRKYGVSRHIINNTPKLIFEGKNPFEKS